MRNNLLLIIDPQNDFVHNDGNYAQRHKGIVQITEACQTINRLLASNLSTPIVLAFSNYLPDQFGDGLSLCIEGTWGHQIGIALNDQVVLLSKSSHSCFSSPDFTAYLRQNNIHQLNICGFLAEYCVKQTAIDGLKEGYGIRLIRDSIGTGDDVQERRVSVFEELNKRGVELINSKIFRDENVIP